MQGIDHFMYAGADMETLARGFAAMTGISTAAGGSHPDLGTRNHLLATDTPTYLELIAPDPAQATSSPLRRALQAMERPQLHRVIGLAPAAGFPALIERYREMGVAAQSMDLQRVTATGEVLKWKLLVTADPNPLGVFAPMFIDWLDTPHPSTRLPASPCTILACEAGHPDKAGIEAFWRAIGFEFPLVQADSPYMRVTLGTPRGPVALTSAR